MNKKLPIKIFEKRKIKDERKTEAGGGVNLPNWAWISDEELHNRVQSFTQTLNKVAEKLDQRDKERDFIPAVITIEMHEKATAKSHRSDIAGLFNGRHQQNLIGLIDETHILVKVNSVDDIAEIIQKLDQPYKFKKGIASVINMEPFEPIVKIDEEKKAEPLRVSLINYHNYQLNQAVSKAFITFCEEKGVDVLQADYSPELIMFRLSNVSSDSFEQIQDFEALETISIMPKYSITLDDFSSIEAKQIKIRQPEKNKSYPVVGILDSGIMDIPHLKPWITKDSFSKIPEDRMDKSHGTSVSSIVVYGDDFEDEMYIGGGGCYLFDATVFPDQAKDSIEEFELVEDIREAIHKNKNEVKIWNLSLGTNDESDLNVFSYFGKALDQIQEESNVIICKSAGNCSNFMTNQPVSRISKSADSVRSLVIGSMAHQKGDFDRAEKFHASPFSRIGKGPANLNKPDLTHVGGNAGVNPNTGKLVTSGVTAFSSQGQLITNIGTSFSTPRISSLLAGLHHKLDIEFNPLLLKALAIHSAKYPDQIQLGGSDKMKTLGYGVPPKIDDILYNDPHEITLILQDNLVKGNWIEIPDLPFPQDLIEDGYYYGEIIVTLVSSPILSGSQGAEYCQSNLKIRLGTYDKLRKREGKTIRNDIGLANSENLLQGDLYAKAHKDDTIGKFARERMLIKYGDKYQPIKKYAVNLAEMTPGNKMKHLAAPKKWYVAIDGLYRDFSVSRGEMDGVELNQDFCLIITIRDNKREKQVYDQATKLLNDNGFIHNNISLKVENVVSVNL